MLQSQRGTAICKEAVIQGSIYVGVSTQALHTNPRVSHVLCAVLVVQTAPGMNTHRQLGETPGCQPRVGQADGRPCGKKIADVLSVRPSSERKRGSWVVGTWLERTSEGKLS